MALNPLQIFMQTYLQVDSILKPIFKNLFGAAVAQVGPISSSLHIEVSLGKNTEPWVAAPATGVINNKVVSTTLQSQKMQWPKLQELDPSCNKPNVSFNRSQQSLFVIVTLLPSRTIQLMYLPRP